MCRDPDDDADDPVDVDAPDVEELPESGGGESDELSGGNEVDVLGSGLLLDVGGGGVDPEFAPEESGGVPEEEPGGGGSIGVPESDEPLDPREAPDV